MRVCVQIDGEDFHSNKLLNLTGGTVEYGPLNIDQS